MTEKALNLLMEAFLEDAAMEEQAAYLRRGRSHATASTEAVQGIWVAGFRAWFHHADHPPAMQQIYADAGAELRLRGVKLPSEKLQQEIKRGQAEIRKADVANGPGVMIAIRRFMKSLDEPSH